MWNRLVEIARDPSYKRLVLAVIVSALLHAWLFGGLHLMLPLPKERIILDARLQPLPTTRPKVEEPVKQVQPQPHNKKTVKKPPKVEPPKPTPEVEPVPKPVMPEPAPVTEEIAPPEPPAEPQQENPPPEQPLANEAPIVNEHTYNYVETYFDVRTKIDGPVEGKATSIFNVDQGQYWINFNIEAQGLAGLVIPNLIQVSRGKLGNTGLQPESYSYQFGNRPDKSRRATFKWQEKSLELVAGSENHVLPLVENSQDVISFMYQFMFVAPLQKMQLNITNGKTFREYDYEFVGEEPLTLGSQQIQAYHIVHNSIDNDEKVELWLCENYQFLPVKIRKIDKAGKFYEFTATQIVTTRPKVEK